MKSVAELQHEIGARLTRAMSDADMDRAELAELTGLDKSDIEAWELGTAPLYPSELITLCYTLDISPNRLLGFDLS